MWLGPLWFLCSPMRTALEAAGPRKTREMGSRSDPSLQPKAELPRSSVREKRNAFGKPVRFWSSLLYGIYIAESRLIKFLLVDPGKHILLHFFFNFEDGENAKGDAREGIKINVEYWHTILMLKSSYQVIKVLNSAKLHIMKYFSSLAPVSGRIVTKFKSIWKRVWQLRERPCFWSIFRAGELWLAL